MMAHSMVYYGALIESSILNYVKKASPSSPIILIINMVFNFNLHIILTTSPTANVARSLSLSGASCTSSCSDCKHITQNHR